MADLHLSPAYGRDYTSKAKVLADLAKGKDFVISEFGRGDTYINLEQMPDDGVCYVRYSKMRQVARITVKEAKRAALERP